MTRPDRPAKIEVAAIVLAGGRSRRFPPDKLAEALGGGTVLDATLDGLPADLQVICVGPRSQTRRSAEWVRESPPLGGPLAAVEAGLAAVAADVSVVLVVAGDLPLAGRAVPDLLSAVRAPAHPTVAVVTDSTGRAQPLLAAWPRSVLVDAVVALRPTNGRAAAALLDSAHATSRVLEIADLWDAASDVDEAVDLFTAQRRTQGRPAHG